MIEKEIYSPSAFLKILRRNNIECEFKRCTLYHDYIMYHFAMKEDKKLNEFQVYSVTFSVIIESENSCYFIGKKGKELIFLLTFTNDLKKYGLKKTPERLGIVPKETQGFDFVKGALERIVWYKFDTKELASMKPLKEFAEDAANAEERAILDAFWKEIS